MNILHHKSWHVRNKDNIERVRRDEENARLEEEKKAKRAALAEQEARTALLRARAKGGQRKEELMIDSKPSASSGSELVPASEQQKHINFFQDIEEGLKQGTNAEYEAEKKAEQEKHEKAIGLLTYLGQSASEKHSDKPWYLKKGRQKQATNEDKDMKRKDSLDPLNNMKKYLEANEKHRHKKHKKEHKHHRIKKKEESSSKKKSIQELRAERLKREQTERLRESELYSSSRGEKKASEHIEDNPYRYNSQFNPDLVRKPRSSHRHAPY